MQKSGLRSGLVLTLLAVAVIVAGCGGDDSNQKQASTTTTASQKSTQTDKTTDEPRKLVVGLPDFSQLVKQVSPAVVNISALPASPDQTLEGDGSGKDNPSENRNRGFPGRDPHDTDPGSPPFSDDKNYVSLGSGFIISSDGYILTNRHVVNGAGKIVVKLSDRRQLVARVVGSDPATDVAVLKVKADHLPAVRIGDARKLAVGAWVVAIGSPFGFETSVTAGIVSGKGRSLTGSQYVPFLQTDVVINPGNSGGPLFNLAGQVVGINAEIYSQTGGYQGISFAIPINVAMRVAHQLRTTGHVTRGWLGVQIQNVSRGMAESFRLPHPEGALVTQIFKDSPAAKAKLKVGDVILSFNGHPVASASDLPPLVGSLTPGADVKLEIWRDDQKRVEKIRIGTLPARYQADASKAEDQKGNSKPDALYGLILSSLTTGQKAALGLGRDAVRVDSVFPGPATRAGLQVGDVILSVGSTAVQTPKSFYKALQETSGSAALLVLRGGERRYFVLSLGH